jgi:hypothetical protein
VTGSTRYRAVSLLPVEEITPDVIAAAAAGDVAQLLRLFAEEIKPEPEVVALAETPPRTTRSSNTLGPRGSARTRASGALTTDRGP